MCSGCVVAFCALVVRWAREATATAAIVEGMCKEMGNEGEVESMPKVVNASD